MKQFFENLKRYKDLKYYFLFLTLVNSIYLYIETYKLLYIEKYSLSAKIQTEYYQYISNFSNINSILEILIILICLVYWIKFIVQKTKININKYFPIHFIFFIMLACVSYFISYIFVIPIGNSIQQLVIIYGVTNIVFLYSTLVMLYRKTIVKLKN